MKNIKRPKMPMMIKMTPITIRTVPAKVLALHFPVSRSALNSDSCRIDRFAQIGGGDRLDGSSRSFRKKKARQASASNPRSRTWGDCIIVVGEGAISRVYRGPAGVRAMSISRQEWRRNSVQISARPDPAFSRKPEFALGVGAVTSGLLP